MNSNSYTIGKTSLFDEEVAGSAQVHTWKGWRSVEKHFYFSNEAELYSTVFSVLANVYQQLKAEGPTYAEPRETVRVSLSWTVKVDKGTSSNLLTVLGGRARVNFDWDVTVDNYEAWKTVFLKIGCAAFATHFVERATS